MLYFWKNDKLYMKKFCIILGIISLILGCTKDDICSGETLTTPLLVIQFRDINNRLEAKQVSSLQILLNNTDSTEVISSLSDTIVFIPLNTEANLSEFIFIQNSASETDSNADNILFSYDRQEIYENRACGFKVNYSNLSLEVAEEIDTENWILDTDINTPIIENENEAHITIYH